MISFGLRRNIAALTLCAGQAVAALEAEAEGRSLDM